MAQLKKSGAKRCKDDIKDNWQTPPEILQSVKDFMWGSYYDPCPPNPANDNVKYGEWWSQEKIYINPPFSKINRWVYFGWESFLRYRDNNKITPHYIWMANANTETVIHQFMMRHSSAILFFNKRLAFINPATGKAVNNNFTGQMLCYWGNHPYTFKLIFENYGLILFNQIDYDDFQANYR